MRQSAHAPGVSRSLFRTASLLSLFATAGCAVTSSDMYFGRRLADESFTYESLREHGIGVLGVTSASFDVPGTTATTDWLGPWFLSEIEKERNDLELIPPRHIAEMLGDASYVRALDAHSEYGALDSATVSDMAGELTEFRYLAVARVDRDTVLYSHTLHESYDDSSCTSVHASMRARAIVKVRFQVYDLKTRAQVWEGVCRSERDRKVVKSAGSWCSAESFVESLVWSILGIEDEREVFLEYPEPPVFSAVLCPCFRRFAQRLPAAPGRR